MKIRLKMFLKVLALSDCCDVMLVGSFTGCFFFSTKKENGCGCGNMNIISNICILVFNISFELWLILCAILMCVKIILNYLCANLNVVIFIVPVYVGWRCSATRFRRKLCRISFILHHRWRLDLGIILQNWHQFLQLLVQNFKIVQNKLK